LTHWPGIGVVAIGWLAAPHSAGADQPGNPGGFTLRARSQHEAMPGSGRFAALIMVIVQSSGGTTNKGRLLIFLPR
jgi:hypothetical protein